MKKIFKSSLSIILVLLMCFSIAGCSSTDNSWVAKYNDETLPIGTYIYLLAAASSEASNLVEDKNSDVLSQTIEDKKAETWIRDEAQYYMEYLFAVKKMMSDRGLTLSDDELSQAKASASSSWAKVSSTLSSYDVAYSSYEKIAIEQAELTKLFNAIYGAGGEVQTTDQAISDYFDANYTYYKYAIISLYKTDADGNTATLEGDDLTAAVAEVNGWVDSYNSGKIDKQGFIDLYKASPYFATEKVPEGQEYTLSESVDKLSASNSASKSIIDADIGKAVVLDYSTSGMLYVAFKENLQDKEKDWLANSDNHAAVLKDLRNGDLDNLVKAETKNLNIEYNTQLMNKQKVSKFFTKTSSASK